MKNIILVIAILFTVQFTFGQNVITIQPSGGLNNGTDSGTATAGKDTWVNRYAPTSNYGTMEVALSSPRSNCNPSDYKSYFQFDVTNLPDVVDSVFFGVTHIEHTSYCYSNCDADFYFYNVTSPWDEMTLEQSNLPTEDATPFFGPLNITFPNDFQNQEYDITSAYNHWKTIGVSNYGFVTYSPTVGCNNASVQFMVYSSDDSIQARRPYLKIYYPNPASTNQIYQDEVSNIYPNPFKDILKVNIKNSDKVYLTDLMGRNCSINYDYAIGGFNTSALNPGLYILQMVSDKKIETHKVLKVNH